MSRRDTGGSGDADIGVKILKVFYIFSQDISFAGACCTSQENVPASL